MGLLAKTQFYRQLGTSKRIMYVHIVQTPSHTNVCLAFAAEISCCVLLAASCRLQVAGCCWLLLAAGCWLLAAAAAGCWLLAAAAAAAAAVWYSS